MADYNGWTNRNTWLINLWFGEIIREEIEQDASITADNIADMVWDCIQLEVELSSLMLRDFFDFEGINWEEIWQTICHDVFYEDK
tara:strand:- start:1454 stop:1708 length:255 start_codon:yes stop_codon:yes gene_type:complete